MKSPISVALPAEAPANGNGKGKPLLPAFWLPSLTPEAKPDVIKSFKDDILCTAADPHHPISLKKLTSVKFHAIEGSTKEEYGCPSCTKTLTNGTKISLLKSCGHVFCSECVEKFAKKDNVCPVCSKKCGDKDVVKLRNSEGTGFSSVGQAEAIKKGIGFQ